MAATPSKLAAKKAGLGCLHRVVCLDLKELSLTKVFKWDVSWISSSLLRMDDPFSQTAQQNGALNGALNDSALNYEAPEIVQWGPSVSVVRLDVWHCRVRQCRVRCDQARCPRLSYSQH